MIILAWTVLSCGFCWLGWHVHVLRRRLSAAERDTDELLQLHSQTLLMLESWAGLLPLPPPNVHVTEGYLDGTIERKNRAAYIDLNRQRIRRLRDASDSTPPKPAAPLGRWLREGQQPPRRSER